VGLGEVGIDEDGLVGELDRVGVLSELAGDGAEEIESVDVVGGELEDLAIEGLGLGELAGAVVRHRLLELGVEKLKIGGRGLRRSGLVGGGMAGLLFHVLYPPCAFQVTG
jgi:hypothetical protein